MSTKLTEYAKSKENFISKLANLRLKESEGANFNNRIQNGRDDQERDYARILYSSSFRRLQGKMQLFIPYSNRFNRNRLTHSLEVAQIARVIAKNIGLQDTLTVQSCSLAHDIGHPPFGHSGEETLNKLGQDVRFEGNAQTFRILNHLEEKHYEYNGLNLTLRTLLGTIKYFQNHAMNEHKFLYDEDYDLVKKISTEHNIGLKTIDAEIMDIADEIAYAAHDLEDAFYFKWFSIDELLYEFSISDKYKAAYSLFKNIVDKARTFAKKAETYQTSEEYLILFKKELTSNIVNELVNNLCVENDKLAYKDDYGLLSEGLKKLTYHAVSRSTENKLYELKGKKIITDLYQVYMDKTFNENMKLLPSEYRDEEEWERSVFDYISGMMDEYAVGKHKEFFGSNALDIIYKQYV
jgi:dGTPase